MTIEAGGGLKDDASRRPSEEGIVGERRLRGDNRNDPILEMVTNDPGVAAVLDSRSASYAEMQACVGDAIQKCDGRKLLGWVAVAVWEDADGTISESVIGDEHSSPLELKGYLHDGIWTAAHAEP